MPKRLFDIVCSLVGLVILSPLLLWIALLIKKEDGGSVFYPGMRVGLHGKPFRIFKFRTMVVDDLKIIFQTLAKIGGVELGTIPFSPQRRLNSEVEKMRT